MQGLTRELRLGKKIVSTQVKDRIHYPARVITDTFIIIARCGILLILYWYVFKLNNGLVNNTPYILVAWSIFFYFAFGTLRLRDIPRSIAADIQSGNIEVLFNKPISYLSYRLWWQIGSGLYPFLVASILGGFAIGLIIGVPQTMTMSIFLPTFVLTFIASVAVSFVVYSIVGLLAFWIEDINPVFWMIDKSIMILGGSYLPVALFPPLMYNIARYSPFGASQFVTHTVGPSWQTDWYLLIFIQLFWILVLGLCMFWIFYRAKEKVSVNGG